MSTEFTIRHRYGKKETANKFDASTVRNLVDELMTEKFEEPDDEHTQISISSDSQFLTLYRDGLMKFEEETAKGFDNWYRAIEEMAEAMTTFETFMNQKFVPAKDAKWFKTEKETHLKAHHWLSKT